MAEQPLTVSQPNKNPDAVVLTWETLAKGDTGEPAEYGDYDLISVQAIGSFDSATLSIKESNDGTTYTKCKDDAASPADVDFTAAGFKCFRPRQGARYIRPEMSGSGGTADVDVVIFGRKRK